MGSLEIRGHSATDRVIISEINRVRASQQLFLGTNSEIDRYQELGLLTAISPQQVLNFFKEEKSERVKEMDWVGNNDSAASTGEGRVSLPRGICGKIDP